MAVINWNTVPDYDQWGSDTWWSCSEWVEWHKKLKDHFGTENAKNLWNYAFAQSGNLSGNLDCRTFDGSFRKYVADNGLQPYANAGIFAPVLQTYGTGTEILNSALKGVNSFFGNNGLKTLFNVILVGAVVYGGVVIYKNVKKQ